MKDVTVWVLTKPDDPALHVLDEAGPGVRYVLGATPAEFAAAPPPDALFVCSIGRAAVEPVLALAPDVGWVHCRSAGLDSLMFPALVKAKAVLTNGKGVFSLSLAEFVIGALLYFTRDFPRLDPQPAARRVGGVRAAGPRRTHARHRRLRGHRPGDRAAARTTWA